MRQCQEFREFRQVQADQRRQEEYAKQGQIVADAISAKMDEAIQAVKQQVGAPPQVIFPPGPPPAGAGTPGAAQEEAPAAVVLSPMQRALVEAHLGKKIKILKGTFEELKGQIMGVWTRDPKAIKNMGEFITNNSPSGSTLPFSKTDRISKYWSVITGLN